MSMPAVASDWLSKKLNWGYVTQSRIGKTLLQPGEMLQLPSAEYIFKYPEGVLLQFSAGFDHPYCGIRIEQNPDLDTEENMTVANTSLGLSRPEILVYTTTPPDSPPGWYSIRACSQWVFKDWMRLYVFNSDTVPHYMMGHSYMIAVLKEERPDESIVPLKEWAELQNLLTLYPELKEPLRQRMEEALGEFIRKKRLRVKEVRKE